MAKCKGFLFSFFVKSMQVFFTVLHGSRFVRSFGHTGGKSALDIPGLYSQVAGEEEEEEEEEEGERIALVFFIPRCVRRSASKIFILINI